MDMSAGKTILVANTAWPSKNRFLEDLALRAGVQMATLDAPFSSSEERELYRRHVVACIRQSQRAEAMVINGLIPGVDRPK